MKLNGIPFLGKNNYNKRHLILNKKTDEYKDTSLYSLFNNIKEKNELIVINNKYLTWLEDTQFNYIDKQITIPYYSYEYMEYELSNREKTTKYIDHLETIDENTILVRFNYKLNNIEINIGSKLKIYNLETNKLTEYTITSWIDEDFSITKLYKLYKDYCFYDANLDFGDHEGGYTYIDKSAKGFYNKEKTLRYEFNLHTYKDDINIELKDYTDVRVYKYFDYISKLKNSDELSIKLFKYRKIDFESYLYCCIQSGKKPIDCPEWDELGNSKYYFKISDGNIPFFIKHEWLLNTNLKNTKTWRKLR